jgi:hypothetical protein
MLTQALQGSHAACGTKSAFVTSEICTRDYTLITHFTILRKAGHRWANPGRHEKD